MNVKIKSLLFSGDALCKISNFGPVFIITSSIYTLVVVSFERHKIIIESRAPKMSSYTLALVIVCIWMLSLIISLPTLMEYSTHAETEEHTERNDNYYEAHDIHEDENATINETVTYFHCDSNSSSEYALGNAVIVFVVAYYVIPVVLMLKNYFDIALFVWRKGRAQRDHVSTRTNNSSSFQLFKHKTKLVKLLVMVATIFAVSWFPYFVLFLYAVSTIWFIIKQVAHLVLFIKKKSKCQGRGSDDHKTVTNTSVLTARLGKTENYIILKPQA